jgi:hypothetical protein
MLNSIIQFQAMNTSEQSNPPLNDQLDPNRAVVPHPNYQSPISEKVENQPNQVLPQVTAANTTYYYDVNASAGAPQIFVVPPEAPPPPPGQAYQHQVIPNPLQTPFTPMPSENVVPPPPKVTTHITSSEYREGEPVTPMPPQAYPNPQPTQEPREEVVRVIITDDRDELDRRDFYYYRDGAAATMTAWMLFAFGWLIGPLWWIGACFIVSKHPSARARC